MTIDREYGADMIGAVARTNNRIKGRTMTTTTTSRVIRVRVTVWGQLQTVRAMIDADGTVRIYDDVAGHYTLRHGLTARQVARIRRLAAK